MVKPQPSQSQRELFTAARDVAKNAYAPHSGLRVGAAIRAANGRIFAGANVENASYPEGWCAETSALAQMVAAGERSVVEVCVYADVEPPISPCGGCRQRLAEFSSAVVPVYSCDQTGLRASWRLGDLLPDAFDLDADDRTFGALE